MMERRGVRDTAGADRPVRSLPLTSRRHIDLLRVCSAASPHRRRGAATGSAR
ncbi:hypothetical protein ACIPPS_13395 [Streptomyces sp. NPDC090127]|uniref:hypothetical protein n=1 Tax=Streptomyces sp. NPDC090127 TaxID=3365953 RepID=UPI00380D0D40